jgi:hypothetical protein
VRDGTYGNIPLTAVNMDINIQLEGVANSNKLCVVEGVMKRVDYCQPYPPFPQESVDVLMVDTVYSLERVCQDQ